MIAQRRGIPDRPYLLLYCKILGLFARRLRIDIDEGGGTVRPCPSEWLDKFFMRHFTGLSALDDTLPAADGLLEAGRDVDLAVLRDEFEKWLRGHKLIAPPAKLQVTEERKSEAGSRKSE